jgi:hypothetical protein
MIVTYGHLYDYIEKELSKNSSDIEAFIFTKSFCEDHHVNATKLISILIGFNAHNDIEVLVNVSERISADTPINQDIETPVEFAIRNNLYSRYHEGMWVRCKQNDKGSIPDLNTAYVKMFKKK